MTRLWLVRHGPTHARAAIGWTDIPADLSDTQAIARLDAHLPRPSDLVSSDLRRAVATADRLGKGRTRLAHRQDLREINFGRWEGQTFDAIAAADPDLSRAFWEEPGDHAAPEGESMNDTVARIARALDDFATCDGDVVVLCHIGAIMAALAYTTGMDLRAVMRFVIDPLSVTSLEAMDGGHWRVCGVNHRP